MDEKNIMTNCCDTWGQCTQGRDCPARTGVVTHAQACHAARVAKSHPHPKANPYCDQQGGCQGKGACHTTGADDMPIQFVGPEPTAPTQPLCDCVPLTPSETRRLMAGITVFCGVFVGAVFFGMGYGWTRFGLDLVAYFSGGMA